MYVSMYVYALVQVYARPDYDTVTQSDWHSKIPTRPVDGQGKRNIICALEHKGQWLSIERALVTTSTLVVSLSHHDVTVKISDAGSAQIPGRSLKVTLRQ
jgi:hypothetical protein